MSWHRVGTQEEDEQLWSHQLVILVYREDNKPLKDWVDLPKVTELTSDRAGIWLQAHGPQSLKVWPPLGAQHCARFKVYRDQQRAEQGIPTWWSTHYKRVAEWTKGGRGGATGNKRTVLECFFHKETWVLVSKNGKEFANQGGRGAFQRVRTQNVKRAVS